ncbi:MAG: NAD-dependent epimerase/dehydratase family protein, partial [Verrucomicrobiota bacterium]|nr:NAD-dependent epimerase/dehydratase family protein [Verrucomicrobiota bacterium]
MIKNILRFKKLPESVIIFGCGYIGTSLAKVLIENGVRVGALTRNKLQAELLRTLGAKEVLQFDLQDTNWPNYLKLPYQSAVNCVSSAGGGLLGYRQSYVDGQKVILDWATTQKLDKFVYTSSTSVYPQDGGVVVTEQMSTQDCSESALLLLESERIIQDQRSLFNKHYIFRLAGIYGPQRHYLLDQLKAGISVIAGKGDYHLNL